MMPSPTMIMLRARALTRLSLRQQQFSSSTVGSNSKVLSSKKGGKLLKKKEDEPSNMQLFVHAGLPMIVFSVLAAWVLKNSIEGKNKEYETSRGQVSK